MRRGIAGCARKRGEERETGRGRGKVGEGRARQEKSVKR